MIFFHSKQIVIPLFIEFYKFTFSRRFLRIYSKINILFFIIKPVPFRLFALIWFFFLIFILKNKIYHRICFLFHLLVFLYIQPMCFDRLRIHWVILFRISRFLFKAALNFFYLIFALLIYLLHHFSHRFLRHYIHLHIPLLHHLLLLLRHLIIIYFDF